MHTSPEYSNPIQKRLSWLKWAMRYWIYPPSSSESSSTRLDCIELQDLTKEMGFRFWLKCVEIGTKWDMSKFLGSVFSTQFWFSNWTCQNVLKIDSKNSEIWYWVHLTLLILTSPKVYLILGANVGLFVNKSNFPGGRGENGMSNLSNWSNVNISDVKISNISTNPRYLFFH